MYLPKCLCFADAMYALRYGYYRTAGAISVNVIRNRLSAANGIRRSKWYLR